MSRPSRTITALLAIVAAINFAGCKTIYTDTYTWQRTHYKPLKETTKDKDLLPTSLGPTTTPSDALPPPLPPVPAPEPAPAPAPEPMAPPAIPGL
jgi:hypothetical protein